jgi:hypothetical protein
MLKSIKDFGTTSRSTLESLLMTEVDEVVSTFKENPGKSQTITNDTFVIPVANIILRIVLGKRCTKEETLNNSPIQRYLTLSHRFAMDYSVVSGLYNFWPFMKTYFPSWSGYNFVDGLCKELRQAGVVSKKNKDRRFFTMADFETRREWMLGGLKNGKG